MGGSGEGLQQALVALVDIADGDIAVPQSFVHLGSGFALSACIRHCQRRRDAERRQNDVCFPAHCHYLLVEIRCNHRLL